MSIIRLLLIIILGFNSSIINISYGDTTTSNLNQSSAASVTSVPAQQNNITQDDLSFILTGNGAILTAQGNGNYLLTITGVSPYVIYYTHRPNQDSGLASTANFVNAWTVGQDSFAVNAPNGIFTASQVHNLTIPVKTRVFQFSKPQYDPQKDLISFIITPIGTLNQLVLKSQEYDQAVVVIN